MPKNRTNVRQCTANLPYCTANLPYKIKQDLTILVKVVKLLPKEKNMKTIKITPELHKDLLKLKAEYELPTIGSTIRFLEEYHRRNKKHGSK